MRMCIYNLAQMANIKISLGFAATLAASSCATYYESVPIRESGNRFTGASYSLPMLQFDITTTRQVKRCVPDVKFVMASQVTKKYVADPKATMGLNFQPMAAGNSTSLIDIKFYDDSRLKSINSAADDKTAELIDNTFTVLFNSALAGAGVPGIVSTPAKASSTSKLSSANVAGGTNVDVAPACSSAVVDALGELEKTKSQLALRTQAVKAATSEVQRLNLLAAAQTQTTETVAQLLLDASKELTDAQEVLVSINNARKPYLDKITFVSKTSWPSAAEHVDISESSLSTLSAPPSKLIESWIGNSNAKRIDTDKIASLMNDVSVGLLLRPIHSDAQLAPSIPSAPEKGIYYRHAIPVTLSVCAGACSADGANARSTTQSLAPQFGPLILVPFENKPFQNNKLDITFAANGMPSAIKFENTKAPASTATGSLASIAKQLPGLRQSLLNKELESLKRKTAIADEKKKLATAQTALEQSPLADMEAQTASLNATNAWLLAQIHVKESQLKLEELEKDKEENE